MKTKPALTAEEHLTAMLSVNRSLYETILDTPVFAYHFNELAKLARTNVGRPFDFTREDAGWLRDQASDAKREASVQRNFSAEHQDHARIAELDNSASAADSLADRIEALLPPE